MIGRLLGLAFKILKDEENRKEIASFTKELVNTLSNTKKRRALVKDLKTAVKGIPQDLRAAAADISANTPPSKRRKR